MRRLIEKINLLKDYDWFLATVVFILSAIGLISIYSVDLSRGEDLYYFPTQLTALIIGFFLMLIAGGTHINFYRYSALIFFIFAVILLVAVLFFGVSVRGTTGWFRLAGFSFQPVEAAKVGLIIFLAWWVDRHNRHFDRWQFVLTSGLIALFVVLPVMFQPDLGSALVLLSIWLLLLLIVGTKKRYIFFLFISFLTIACFFWFLLLKDYQKDRLLIFLYPESDPLGSGYNVTQSIIAIGAGNFFGRGLGFGSQSQLHFLPEAQTDFIFSVIAEELGFVGVTIVISLYFLIFWRLLKIAQKAKNDFSAYLVIGIFSLFFIQLTFNLGGATGLLPVTGVTLPFLSYGGSSLIINYFLLGIAESVYRSSHEV